MSLQAAILASLLLECGSGYELSKDNEMIHSCVSGLWQVPQQQVYRELKKMESDGLITSRIISQEKRLDKKIYEITEQGRQHLAQWALTPVEPAATRDALLVKIFSGYIVNRESLLAELDRHEKLHAEQLQWFQGIQDEHYQDLEALDDSKKFPYLVLQHRLGEERLWVTWCQQAKAFLKDGTPIQSLF